MSWLPHQKVRLAHERKLLSQLLPSFEFHDMAGDTYVEGTWVSQRNHKYTIRIVIPKGYPDELPSSYITHPSPLRGYHRPIEESKFNHRMHTWPTDHKGWVKVCTMLRERWSAKYSLEWLARKAMLWIVAYECHLDDGRPISDFLLTEPLELR